MATPIPLSTVDPQNPWLGLASFTEETRAYFHGRDEEIAELSRRVQRKLLTVLFGQSGHGKTSLLRAGLVPLLRPLGYCPVYVRVDHSPGSPPPSEQIKHAVFRATAEAGTWTRSGVSVPGESLWEFLHHRDDFLKDANGRTLTPLVIFDQFEEVFTLAQTDAEGRGRVQAFLGELADLVENRPPVALEARLDQDEADAARFDFTRSDYRILITLREDYLPHLEGLKKTMPSVTQNRVRLAEMKGTQALDAVLKPGGAIVTDEVARAIVEFVAGARGGSTERLAELDVEPPLLSVICRELNDRRRALGHAQITADLVTGNRREILTDFYDRSIADLPEPMRRFVEDKLLTKSGFRDNLALETALQEPGVTRELIDTLVARRLLRVEDRMGKQRVELTHDVLADVVRASRDARQQRLALDQAREREQRALADAARRTRRMRWAIVGLTLAVVALGTGAVFGIRAQVLTRQQASRNDLLLGSRLVDEGRVSDGVAYLVRSARKDRHNDVIASRLLSILASQNFAFPAGEPLALPSPAETALYFPDGKRIVSLGQDGVVRIIDAERWQLASTWNLPEPAEGTVIFNGLRTFGIRADERFERFAVKLRSGGLIVCGLDGKPLGGVIRAPGGAPAPYFDLSPDGRWLGGTDDTTLWIWDARSGELCVTLPHNGQFRFSPDSRKVATFQRGSGGQSTVHSVPDGAPGAAIAYVYGGSSGRFFTGDSQRLLILHGVGVQAYDIASGKPAGPLLRNLVGGNYTATLSPDGTRLALTGQKAVVIDLATSQALFAPFEHGGRIREAGFSRDGRTLFTNSIDGLFRLWNLETGRLLGTPMHRQEQFTPAALAPDGRQVAIFTGAGPVQRLQFRRHTATALALPRPGVRSSNFLPGGPPSVIWFKDSEAQAIEIATGRQTAERFPLATPVGFRSPFGGTAEPGDTYYGFVPSKGISAVVMGERGPARIIVLEGTETLAGLGALAPGRNHVARLTSEGATIWDSRTGRLVTTILSRTRFFVGAARVQLFNPDESRIALTGADGTVQVHEVATGRELFKVQPGRKQFSTFRLLADGRLLTGGTDGELQLWDSHGTSLQDIRAHAGTILRFDVSRDGRTVASISDDSTVQVWDSASFRRICTIPIEVAAGVRIEFSWDGTRLIAPWRSGARVWDVRTGQPVTEGLEHEGVQTVSYGPDDGRFASTTTAQGLDSVQRLWAVPPRAAGQPTPDWLLTLAAAAAGQRLTDSGELEPATEEMARLEDVRRTVRGLPATDPFASWAQWILSEDANRPIAPGFKITAAEAETLARELTAAGSSTPAP